MLASIPVPRAVRLLEDLVLFITGRSVVRRESRTFAEAYLRLTSALPIVINPAQRRRRESVPPSVETELQAFFLTSIGPVAAFSC